MDRLEAVGGAGRGHWCQLGCLVVVVDECEGGGEEEEGVGTYFLRKRRALGMTLWGIKGGVEMMGWARRVEARDS